MESWLKCTHTIDDVNQWSIEDHGATTIEMSTMDHCHTMSKFSMSPPDDIPPARRRRRPPCVLRRTTMPLFFCAIWGLCMDRKGVVTAFQPFPLSTAALRQSRVLSPAENGGVVLTAARSPDLPSKKQSDSSKTRPQSSSQSGRREEDQAPRIRNSVISLNNEIFALRKENNGAQVAEQRLQAAIEELRVNADQVHEWLKANDKKMLKQYPDGVSFNSVLSAFAKNAKRDPMAASRAERLLLQMEDLSARFPHLRPSIFAYNAVLEAFAKNCNHVNFRTAQQNQLGVLRWFRKVCRDPALQPNAFSNNLVLTSSAISSLEWQSMEQWAMDYLDGRQVENIPDRNTYNQLLQCSANTGEGYKAEDLLQMIVTSKVLLERPDRDIKANSVWFHLVLKAMANAEEKQDKDGERAEKLLRQMYELHQSGYGDIRPDASSYNHVLNVCSGLGNTDQVERLVEELEMMLLAQTADGVMLKPDRVTFTTAIKAYATRQRLMENVSSTQLAYGIAVNATKLFDRMNSLATAGWGNLTPNAVTYNTLISIWTKVGTREGLHTAATLFQKLCEDPQNQPDSVTYTSLIHGWSRGVSYLARLPEAGYRAEQLLQQLEQLPPHLQRKDFSPTKVYNSVITAWSRSGETVAAARADDLLSRLEKKYFSGETNAQPNKTTFLCMIGAYASARITDADFRCDALLDRMRYYRNTLGLTDLEPDKAVYNAVLNALAKSSQPNAVEKVEEILTMMQTAPDTSLRPDIVTYSTVIDCHTKCGGSPDRAEELLRFVEGTFRSGDKGLEPNPVFYSAILQAWAKTATEEGAHKAEELLRRNIALFAEGHQYAAPHAILYNAVMDAIARTGEKTAGSRAEDLLNEMEALYQSGSEQLKPSRRSFNAVILAYRNAGDGGKKAEEILWRMEQLAEAGRPELTPDVVSYNCAISAIVHSTGGKDEDHDVADRAQALLDRMEERRILPDGRTYSPVIEAWLKRNDEKGHALAEAMLQQFLDKVAIEKKKKKPGNSQDLYEDKVWDVINAYRNPEGDL